MLKDLTQRYPDVFTDMLIETDVIELFTVCHKQYPYPLLPDIWVSLSYHNVSCSVFDSSSRASFNESSKRSRNSVTYSQLVFTSGMFTSLVHNSFRTVQGPLNDRPYNNWNGLNPVDSCGTSLYAKRTGLIRLGGMAYW